MRTEKQNRQPYPSDITDAQCEVIKPLYSNLRSCFHSDIIDLSINLKKR